MKRHLPASLDQVAGLRSARWFRESTSGQFDNFGPDAQRDQQDRAIARYGLLDTGLEWSVAASGWTSAWRTPAWEAMIAAAARGAFDVLVIGYASRFLRNLRMTLNVIEEHLHAAGVVVVFADERLLSSDPLHWDQFVREAHEAEAYSRKLSRRVGEGYAAKRRRLGVPGGNRPPYGMIREGKPSVLRIDEAKATVVRRAYELAATGQTDLEVATAVGLKKTHVGELLTNPIYAGRLRTGEPAGVAVIVDPGLWAKVQAMRERRRTRQPGRIVRGQYALRLRCTGCGRYLFGDGGRYRHPAPTCAGFIAGTPNARLRYTKGDDRRAGGHSYPQASYEDAIGALLGELGRLDDAAISEVVRRYTAEPVEVDRAALVRIAREREEAGRALAQTRDVLAWQREMARLDGEEAAAKDTLTSARLPPGEVVRYLRSLPALWQDSGPAGRKALVGALFARTDVTGFERLEYELTPDAIELGLGDALPAEFVFVEKGGFGRGERAWRETMRVMVAQRAAIKAALFG
jgi:DNA invertase Pin-like site-specific DNA recombinase